VKWQKDIGRMHISMPRRRQLAVLYGTGSSFAGIKRRFLPLRLDKQTGKTLWKVARDEKTSWSTPLIVEHEGKPQVIVSATKRVRGYDLSSGAQLWECAAHDNVVSSPVHYQAWLLPETATIPGDGRYPAGSAKGDITAPTVSHGTQSANAVRLLAHVYDDTLYFLRHNQNVLPGLIHNRQAVRRTAAA